MKILFIDSAHPSLMDGLESLGLECNLDETSPREKIMEKLPLYGGLVVRSRFPIDREFIKAGKNLKFIARVGAGLENIDCIFAGESGIELISAPEGNRQAVGEHALGMLLMLLNNLASADAEVRKGVWLREKNRGYEVAGKIIGIIGYGNMGRSFARCISGLSPREIICYDILPDVGDEFARQVSLGELFEKCDILSLHTPQTELTKKMVDGAFLEKFKKPVYLINTARGSAVVSEDLAEAMESGRVLGAALDVLEWEKSSFENMFESRSLPSAFKYLTESKRTVLSPHIAGWTHEANRKMAEIILGKIQGLLQLPS